MLKGSITSVLLKNVLSSLLDEWNLNLIPKTLVTDQGSNILLAGRLDKVHHLNCFSIKWIFAWRNGLDSIPQWNELIEKFKKIVQIFLNKDQEIKERQEEIDVSNTSLKNFNKTRWNSTCIRRRSYIM